MIFYHGTGVLINYNEEQEKYCYEKLVGREFQKESDKINFI